jgi:hypothetical protein
MFLWVILAISIFTTVILIYRSFGLLKIFHWYELTIIFLFIASVNSYFFGIYQSAYETLTIMKKPKEYMITYIQFDIMFPISMLWIVSKIKRKVSPLNISCSFLIWNIAYTLVLEVDTFFEVMKIKHSHWYPIFISTGYNITSIVLTIFFMKFLKGKLIKEGKWSG